MRQGGCPENRRVATSRKLWESAAQAMLLLLGCCIPIALADTSTGPKKRSWMDSASGLFTEGPPAISSFACAEAGGRVILFGGYISKGEGCGV